MDTHTRDRDVRALQKLTRLTNYLAVAQIFLKENVFLKESLQDEHVKDRLLGHWGTCPGINLVYAHTNRLARDYKNRDFLITVGPGHGFPAYQANVLVEGSLTHFNSHTIPYTEEGFTQVVKHFSVPYGYPSHLNPHAPGVILEGGELGYSLAVATGTILDNKKLVNVCIIGDGEAETATLATSWNVNSFISPETDGAVLPILHLNGYKISGPTIYGRMSEEDLRSHFESLGWKVYYVESAEERDSLHAQLLETFDDAMQDILRIQEQGSDTLPPQWPMIILRTPKGVTGPKEVEGKKIEGNCDAHQVVFSGVKGNSENLHILEDWLHSYHIDELIRFEGEEKRVVIDDDIIALLPEENRRVGRSSYAHGERMKMPKTPQFRDIFVQQEILKDEGKSSMEEAGKYLRDLIRLENEVRLFSPDETYSNKLHAIFEATKRVWQRKLESWDKDFGRSGRVIEMLSENVLFGMLWGYTLTGRYGYFATYESFGQIVASMADQYVKFIKVAREVPFRNPVPSLNVILSSLLERQDHNGFSHQNPSFIAENLDRDHDIVAAYFPADKNLMKLAMEKTMHSFNRLNIIVVGKRMRRTFLTREQAEKQAEQGIMTWDWFSQRDPHITIVTIGDYVTEEAIAGLILLRKTLPHIRTRFVNVFCLNVFDGKCSHFSREEIVRRFLGKDTGILFHYHGYATTIEKLIFPYDISDRTIIHGYRERGSTTSPFDMLSRNELTRYHLVRSVARLAHKKGLVDADGLRSVEKDMNTRIENEKSYIKKHFVDPLEVREWDKEINIFDLPEE